MAIASTMKIPKIYKSGDLMYVCTPHALVCNTLIKVYNITTGAFVCNLTALGTVVGFTGNVKMTANAPWGSGVAACDVFVLQDEENSLDRVQGVNITTHQWWSTEQWSFNQ